MQVEDLSTQVWLLNIADALGAMACLVGMHYSNPQRWWFRFFTAMVVFWITMLALPDELLLTVWRPVLPKYAIVAFVWTMALHRYRRYKQAARAAEEFAKKRSMMAVK